MRWIVLPCVLVLGCGFEAPLGAPGTDGGRDDGPGSDAGMDGPSIDGAPSSPAALKRQLEVVAGRVAGGPHANFPLLVKLTGSWLRTTAAGGNVANTNGFDIGFFADEAGTMRLSHEVELYDGTNGALVAWVKVPSLTAMSTLFIHYGDPAITTSQQDIPGVWSGGFSGVWHLGGVADSASTNNGTDSGSTAATGQIGNARRFDGSNDFIDVGSGTSIDDIFSGGGTVEAWFNAAGWGEDNRGRILEKGVLNGNNFSGWSFAVDNSNVTGSILFAYGSTSFFDPLGVWNVPANSVMLNQWTHVAVVYDRGSAANDPSIFINGTRRTAMRTNGPGGAMTSDASHNGRIGNRATGDRTFNGTLDEVRMATAARSADWILTTFRNQSDPAGFLTVSAQL